jgi:hypothetical protein
MSGEVQYSGWIGARQQSVYGGGTCWLGVMDSMTFGNVYYVSIDNDATDRTSSDTRTFFMFPRQGTMRNLRVVGSTTMWSNDTTNTMNSAVPVAVSIAGMDTNLNVTIPAGVAVFDLNTGGAAYNVPQGSYAQVTFDCTGATAGSLTNVMVSFEFY